MFMKVVQWSAARLREPSTYAGLTGLMLAMHVANAASWSAVAMSAGMAVGGALAIVMPESK